MYAFILNMWITRRVDENRVRNYVPLFISDEECNMILATPQLPVAQ